jgi:hypothetical protein
MNEYAELQKMTADQTRFFVVTMLTRPGATAFSERLENTLYPPGTPKNELFQITIVRWPDDDPVPGDWCVLSFPIADRPAAEKIANECGLRFADGVPTILPGPLWFPMSGANVWTLESRPSGDIPSPDERARRGGMGWG